MSRVSIFMLPEPGHYLPTLRLAQRLQAAGNSVCYITLPYYQNFFRSQGFNTHEIAIPGIPDDARGNLFGLPLTGIAVVETLAHYLYKLRIGLHEFIKAEVSRSHCDLLIIDTYILMHLGPVVDDLGEQMIEINITLPDHGPRENRAGLQEVVLCPYELEIPRPGARTVNRMYGEPSISRQRGNHSSPWQELSNDKPLIYCSFGSQVEAYHLAADVLTELMSAFASLSDLHFVLASGASYRSKHLQLAPPNVMLVESAPQAELLDRATAFVTHGGLGSVKEAIVARVPMVVIPFFGDQLSNAKRVEYHELGYACPPELCTARGVAELLNEVRSNERVRANLNEMAHRFAQIEHEAPIASVIGELLAGRKCLARSVV